MRKTGWTDGEAFKTMKACLECCDIVGNIELNTFYGETYAGEHKETYAFQSEEGLFTFGSLDDDQRLLYDDIKGMVPVTQDQVITMLLYHLDHNMVYFRDRSCMLERKSNSQRGNYDPCFCCVSIDGNRIPDGMEEIGI